MKIKYSLAIALCGIALSSCSDFLDETPKGHYIPESIDDFGMMLDDYQREGIGQNRVGHGQSNTLTMTDDVRITDDAVSLYGNWGLNAYKWADFIYDSGEHDIDYERFYHVIYVCNYILDHISEAEGGKVFTRNEVEGAAYFHRANAYLNLVNLYAKHYDAATADHDDGVVLMLSADPNLILPRSSVSRVYKQIVEDGEKALSLLPDKVVYKFRPDRAAGNALLARTGLFMGDYKMAEKYADAAIAMTGDPVDYNSITIQAVNPDFGFNNFPTYLEPFNYPDVICYKTQMDANYLYNTQLSEELDALFDHENDLRYTLFTTDLMFFGMEPHPAGVRHFAYMADANRGYGVGEMFVTSAEAKTRLGDTAGGCAVLNRLLEKRMSSGSFVPVEETDTQKLLDRVLDERRKELMFKGLRFFDLKRLNKDSRYRKTIVHTLQGKTYTLAPDDNHYVLPIPVNVIEINNKITQNPR